MYGFTDEVVAPHQGADRHMEVASVAVVVCDAAERMHDQHVLKDLQCSWATLRCNVWV